MLFAAKCKEVPPVLAPSSSTNSLPLEKFNFMTKILVWPSGAVQCLLHFWMVYDTFVMAGPTTHLVLREEDVVKLELEFLQNRDLHISQVTLERETGVINGHFSGMYLLSTMYDFHNSTDTLKFWTEKWAINKTFLFFIQLWWNLVKL